MAADKPKSLADCTDEDYATMNEVISQEPGLHRVVLNDKPKNLADELTVLAEWIEALPQNDIDFLIRTFRDRASDVRAMAERVRDCAVLPIITDHSESYGLWSAYVWPSPTLHGYGHTREEAIADYKRSLVTWSAEHQHLLDQQKG